jgi:hypothetical protein
MHKRKFQPAAAHRETKIPGLPNLFIIGIYMVLPGWLETGVKAMRELAIPQNLVGKQILNTNTTLAGIVSCA